MWGQKDMETKRVSNVSGQKNVAREMIILWKKSSENNIYVGVKRKLQQIKEM